MKTPRDIVSDHAVLRYLERVYGVDIDGVRARITEITAEGRENGACGIKADGVSYKISKSGRVVTVHGVSAPLSNRARRWQRRRK
ncbi:hypothetical protein [Roseobacter sp. OBYS 0001]|uniref:hypothetical protein n=1 Tax=Roseobacter sp. OBYS 0001 TaxID=882651 RepID=UPI001BBED76F|nr:hypothetical protein [Roseobacter sp. OBYS 0001]GIT85428.1 hypothetical protein ROBYS_04440 [Roseobacter sp. OBYS 0001]